MTIEPLSSMEPVDAHTRANDVLTQILEAQWHQTPAMILDSPPGAGKTGVAVRVAGLSLMMKQERCLIVTQTNRQAFDVAHRLCQRYQSQVIHLFVRKDLVVPAELGNMPNIILLHSARDLPAEPAIVVGNAVKWSWLDDDIDPFDLMIIDEAYQLPDYRFRQLANLARRVLLIGDPGQIDPVITSDTSRWEGCATAPHLSCPKTLLTHFPDLPVLQLPISRRLPHSTVEVVQPIFYPELCFESLDAHHARRLICDHIHTPVVRNAIEPLNNHQSLIGVSLPALETGEHDPAMAATIAQTASDLVGSQVIDGSQHSVLEASDIGIVCAHRSQVQAIRENLPDTMQDVLVETTERFQGLERKVILVHHPLSGRRHATAFHLDMGRLCVMLTRHRIACLVFYRAQLSDILEHAQTGHIRQLGQQQDTTYQGLCAHRQLLTHLSSQY